MSKTNLCNKKICGLMSFFISLASCQNPNSLKILTVADHGNLSGKNEAYEKYKKTIINKILNKKPFTGPIGLQVNSGMLHPATTDKILNLSGNASYSAFKTKSIPEGNVLYQANFSSEQEENEFLRNFQASDSRRYTLYIQKTSHANNVEVFLNGTSWIKDSDMVGADEIARDGIYLHTNNSLLVRFYGPPGALVSVTVVESDHAKTLLRHSDTFDSIAGEQSSHVNRGDINVYNPNDVTSLGNLIPYHSQGDLELPASGSDPAIKISGFSSNGERPFRFETGVLIVRFKDPQTGIELMRSQFGGEVIGQVDDSYKIKVDLSKSPVSQIANLIQEFNQHVEHNIEDVSFSSLDSMRTLAIALELQLHHYQIINGIDFNQIAETAISFDDIAKPGPVPLEDCNKIIMNSWWLTQTHTDAAWERTIGSNVKVAWMDMGWQFPNSELEDRRVHFGIGDMNLEKNWINPTSDRTHESADYHGLYAMLVGFAERGNNIGTAGVAPNAQVLPFKTVASWDFAKSIKQAREYGVDVIGINYGFQKTNIAQWLVFNFGDLIADRWASGDTLKRQISKTITFGIPVVIAAHNYHEYISNWEIIDLFEKPVDQLSEEDKPLKSLVVVGSVTGSYITPGVTAMPCVPTPSGSPASFAPPAMYANYDNTSVNKNGAGSNFGHNMVWAPGYAMYVGKRNDDSNVQHFDGTSAATPFVTGVVALMKSRNPAMRPQEIQDALLASKVEDPLGNPIPINPNPNMQAAGISANLLDVKKAVEFAGATKTASTLYGLITSGSSSSGWHVRLNQYAQQVLSPVPSTLSDANEREKDITKQTVSDTVWNGLTSNSFYRIKGWSDVNTGSDKILPNQLEILDIEPICTNTSCANFKPTLQDLDSTHPGVSIDPASPSAGWSAGFNLTFRGQDLVPDLNDTSIAANNRFTVNFTDASPPPPGSGATPLPEVKIPVSSQEILKASNDGSEVQIHIPARSSPVPPPGNYKISLSGFGQTNEYAGSGFQIKEAGAPPSGGFSIKDIPPPVPHINLWLLRDGQRLEVPQGGIVGVAFNNQDLSQLEVEVVQGDTVLNKAKVVEIANDYAAFEVPQSVEPGVKDLLFKIGANRLLVKDAIDIKPSGPVSISWNKRDIFTNGQDSALLTINLRDEDGNPVPDGAFYYVGLSSNSSDQISFASPEYQPFEGRPFGDEVAKVHNSKIELNVTSLRKISPADYPANSNWPSPGHPAIQVVSVCYPNYSSYSGWFCAQSLGSFEEQPRLYLKDVFSVIGPTDTISVQAGGGGASFSVFFYDRAGLPVPNGTAIYVNSASGGSWSGPGGPNGPLVTTENEVRLSFVSGPTSCWGGGGSYAGISFRNSYSDWGDYFLGGVEPIYVLPYDKCPGY